MRVRCHTSHAIEFACGPGRDASCSASSPSTVRATLLRTRSYPSASRSETSMARYALRFRGAFARVRGLRRDVVAEEHRRHREALAVGPDRGEVLLLAHDDLADPDPLPLLHHTREEGVRLRGCLPRRGEVVGPFEVDRIDGLEGHEVFDVD